MTATVPEQLRTFHITGHGMDEAIPTLSVESIAAGRVIPALESSYPIRLASGLLVPFDAEAAVTLPIAALLEARAPRHAAFLETLRRTAERLEDLLALDASHATDAVSAGTLHSSLGAGGQYLDTASLTTALRRRTNPVHRMSDARRNRCSHALTALRQALAVVHPPFAMFHAGPVPNAFCGQLHHSADPCAAAVEHARNQLIAVQGTLRALRLARLELEDAYVPELHDPILQRFHWEAADPSEIAAQPPVVVVMTAEELAARPLHSLSHALRSGCPMLILVLQPAIATGDIKSTSPDLAQIALAHREAYVLQTSLGHPAHLQSALAAMTQSLHPVFALIATPAGGGWPESYILPLARAWPLFTYNPGSGETRQQRMEVHPVAENTWTAAHAVACDPALKYYFRALPDDLEDADAIELGQYLTLFPDRAPLAIPYLTTSSGSRLAVSRDLAEFCRDRLHSAQLLEPPAPPPTALPEPPANSRAATEQAMRQGAEIAVARAVALLTGTQP